ncbi:MAG: FAD-dependent oxidoreductase [Chloroflexi bacterium]|nr:FAD-dependent oxidoreductase [Chloroflexota bacterium]
METVNMETDVVVIGYGAAGANAAIAAHDKGAKVILLEKMATGGGNSRVCGGNLIIPRDMRFADYLDKLSFGTAEREIIDAFVEGATQLESLVKEMGGELVPSQALSPWYTRRRLGGSSVSFPKVPGTENIARLLSFKGQEDIMSGNRLWRFFSSNVERRGINVMLRTPAKELVKNQRGEVVGVIAESDGRTISIKARKGVVLTSGGFENNNAMKWDNLPIKAPVMFMGNPGNTGDGIRMAQKIGAGLWHMGRSSTIMGFKAPEYESAFYMTFLAPGFIYVDKYGRRFVDEATQFGHEFLDYVSFFDMKNLEYPYIPIYGIFDEEARLSGPLYVHNAGYNRDKYKWSLDNKAEIERGWIIEAKTLPELAKRLSMDTASLENTLGKYNESCKMGTDAEFGRPKEHLKSLEPPYYAISLWPTLLNTQGGPRRDKGARVLDPDGMPIPRLYAAGELGSIWGFLYQTSCNIVECIVFGRIAGINAATNPPIES